MKLLLPISLAKLNVLAGRAIRALNNHKALHPAIAVFESTLVPAASAFTEAFNTVQTSRAIKSHELSSGRQGIEKLYTGIQAWLGAVRRDLPGFELDVPLDPESPDQVIGYAESLIALIESRADQVPYATTLTDNLSALLPAARADWTSAQGALGQFQAHRAELRTRATLLNRELIPFRRTLRTVLGSQHRDYQLLRATRGSTGDGDGVVEVVERVANATQPQATPPVAPPNGISQRDTPSA